MSERHEIIRLQDMLQALQRIEAYIEGSNYAQFLSDSRTQDAVVRNLEIIGEAAKAVTDQTRQSYPAVPWQNMARLRDRLIHHYFGVNLDIVWHIIHDELPNVAIAIEAIIRAD